MLLLFPILTCHHYFYHILTKYYDSLSSEAKNNTAFALSNALQLFVMLIVAMFIELPYYLQKYVQIVTAIVCLQIILVMPLVNYLNFIKNRNRVLSKVLFNSIFMLYIFLIFVLQSASKNTSIWKVFINTETCASLGQIISSMLLAYLTVVSLVKLLYENNLTKENVQSSSYTILNNNLSSILPSNNLANNALKDFSLLAILNSIPKRLRGVKKVVTTIKDNVSFSENYNIKKKSWLEKLTTIFKVLQIVNFYVYNITILAKELYRKLVMKTKNSNAYGSMEDQIAQVSTTLTSLFKDSEYINTSSFQNIMMILQDITFQKTLTVMNCLYCFYLAYNILCQVEIYFADCAKIIDNISNSRHSEEIELGEVNSNVEKTSLNCWKVIVILTQTLNMVIYLAYSWNLESLTKAMGLNEYPLSELISSSVFCISTAVMSMLVHYF